MEIKSSCILSIGSELLEGSVLDTNAFFLGRQLSDEGIRPECVRMVPDNKEAIISVMKDSLSKYDIVFTTGGLGPTFDDLTSECAAEVAGVKWERNENAFTHMSKLLKAVGVELNENHYRQANLPKGCDLFENYLGTALGFGISVGNSYVVCMPGVPTEMTGMFTRSVMPFLRKRFEFRRPYKKEIHIGAVPESDVDTAIAAEGIPAGTECIINAGKGEIVVKLRGHDKEAINGFAEKIIASFPLNFIGYNGSGLPYALAELLKTTDKTAAFAESCTGGLVSKMFTDIPGASDIFLGSVVSYANSIKENILKVKRETLLNFGAVSPQTAQEMAAGVILATGADFGLSVTGIAGPGGGTAEKPVGTVFIGMASKNQTASKGFKFRGGREDIRLRAANAAFFQMLSFIREKTGEA